METRKVPATRGESAVPSVVVADAVTEVFEEHESMPTGAETLDPELRYELVRRAAYSFAEQRGFEPGHELDDWLAAEAAIDAQLGPRPRDG
jgi:hypothetical protein